MYERVTFQTGVVRLVLYVILVFFAFIMLFPFLYMMATSFKTSSDVFRYPPRLLPYSPELIEYDGQNRPVYIFNIDGQERHLVLTGERERFGFFSTAELMNVAEPRQSEIVVQTPLDEVTATGETVTLTGADGRSASFEVFTVPVGGQNITMLLAYRGALDRFVDPDDPTVEQFAVARTSQPAEFVEFQLSNYETVLSLNLDRALINTTIVTLGVTIGQLVTSIFGGYAFSRIQFRGRDTIFIAYLGSIMIPFVVLIIPMYRLMVSIGWQNKLVALIVPWIFTAYGTFLLRQFFLTIPRDLEEAALMDGCSRLRILWQIFVPLSTPAVATLAIFSFLYAWNSFLWPLLIIGEGNEPSHVLTLSLIRLSNIAADRPNLVLTGAAVAIIPPMLIFILAQRWFIEGVATSGLKG
jgi:ABC-type glycerol-3-phosphate transport system permease component